MHFSYITGLAIAMPMVSCLTANISYLNGRYWFQLGNIIAAPVLSGLILAALVPF